MRRSLWRGMAWLLVAAAGLAEGKALAEGDVHAPNQADRPAGVQGKYADACVQGNAKYASHDFAGAITLYRGAIEIDGKNPLAYYLMGEAQLAAGKIVEAEAAWNQASSLASDKDPAVRARILFVIADLKERQWKWDEAKAAWQAYLDWVNRAPNNGFPASARSRQQVIDVMLKQDKAYEIVRKRIAETKDGSVFTDLSKTPPQGNK